MKAKFLGDKPIDYFGVIFEPGVDTDCSEMDENAKAKVRGNNHFEVTEGDAAPPKKRGRSKKDKPEAEVTDDA